MIIKKELKGQKKQAGELVNVYDYAVNMDYWRNLNEPISLVIDEFHNIANARSFMSKKNKIFNTWLTMIRRVLGSTEAGQGDLILISQLSNQIDMIARELCHQVRYHICHYQKTCKRCRASWKEDSDMPENLQMCPICRSYDLIKHSHRVEIFHFRKMESFTAWKEWGMKSYYRHYIVNDIEDYFPFYNTLQWSNLFEDH